MKTGLIIGGSVLGLFVVYMIAKSQATGTVSTGTGTGTSVVPGSSGGGTGSSTKATDALGSTGNATVSGLNAARKVATAFYDADKYVLTLGGLL